MRINGRKVAKIGTEQRIVNSLPPGWTLVHINWKKGGKVHIMDGFGRIKIIHFSRLQG